MNEDDKLIMRFRLCFDHPQKVVLEEHEIRSLQSLLQDYCSIISQFEFPTSVWSSFIIEIPSLKDHPSPQGHGWELTSGRCRPVCQTHPALPAHLPEPELMKDSEESKNEMRIAIYDEEDNIGYHGNVHVMTHHH